MVFNSPTLHLTPEPNNQVAPSPSDLLLTQGRVPHTGGGVQDPQETQISTITVRVATSNISSPSQRSSANTRNHDAVNHEGVHQQVRGDHEEDTESKLLELHKQVAKMLSDFVKPWNLIRWSSLGSCWKSRNRVKALVWKFRSTENCYTVYRRLCWLGIPAIQYAVPWIM